MHNTSHRILLRMHHHPQAVHGQGFLKLFLLNESGFHPKQLIGSPVSSAQLNGILKCSNSEEHILHILYIHIMDNVPSWHSFCLLNDHFSRSSWFRAALFIFSTTQIVIMTQPNGGLKPTCLAARPDDEWRTRMGPSTVVWFRLPTAAPSWLQSSYSSWRWCSESV